MTDKLLVFQKIRESSPGMLLFKEAFVNMLNFQSPLGLKIILKYKTYSR